MASSFSGALARYILALTAIASTAISAAFVFTDYNFIKFCVIDGTEAVVCTGDIFNTISSSINEIVNEDESEFARISAIIALSSGALGTLLAPVSVTIFSDVDIEDQIQLTNISFSSFPHNIAKLPIDRVNIHECS